MEQRSPLEKTIVAAILRYLRGLPDCWCIKIHGNIYSAGIPDILGTIQGRALALEVKRPGGKPTDLQAAELARWTAAGAITGVPTSVGDVVEILKEHGVSTA